MRYRYRGMAFYDKVKTPQERVPRLTHVCEAIDTHEAVLPQKLLVGTELWAHAELLQARYPEAEVTHDTRAGMAHAIWWGYADIPARGD